MRGTEPRIEGVRTLTTGHAQLPIVPLLLTAIHHIAIASSQHPQRQMNKG